MSTLNSTVTVVLALATITSAFAQAGTGFTITHGDVVFAQGDSPTSPTSQGPNSDFRVTGPGGTDHLIQSWWWFRVNGVDQRENSLYNSSGTIIKEDTALTAFSFASIDVNLYTAVHDTGIGTGTLTSAVEVLNTTAAPLSVEVFNYADLDVNGTSENTATLIDKYTMEISAGGWTANYFGFHSNWQAGTYPDVRNMLTNTSVDNFNSSGLPLNGNFTGGRQSSIELEPANNWFETSQISVVPEPSTALAVGFLSLSLIAHRARFRNR